MSPSALVGVVAFLVSAAWSWRPSLWTDEAATISAARRSPAELWRMLHHVDAVHGLFYAVNELWIHALGSPAWLLRLPSAVAVALTAATLTLIVRRLGGSAALAVGCGLACALLPRTTWMGIEARSYAWTALAAVALTGLAVTAGTTRRWVMYGALAAVSIVLNLYLALLLLAHGVTLLLLRAGRPVWQRFLPAAGAAVLLAGPVLVTAAGQSGQLGERRPSPIRLVRSILVNQAFLGDTPTVTTADDATFGASPGEWWQPAAVLLAVLATGLVVLAVIRLARTAPGDAEWAVRPRLLAWAVPWAVLPSLLVGGYAMFGGPLYNPRYFSFCAPAVGLAIGVGLAALRSARVRVGAAALLVLLAAPIYVSQRGSTAKNGTDWASVADHVAAAREPGQGVYFAPRYPSDDPIVGRTLRTVRIAYPDAFAGLTDVTEVATPVAAADLTGTSARLTDSADRIARADTLWVIRRDDYPAERATAEDDFLAGQGLHLEDVWRGPLTTVLEFRR